MGQEQMPEVKRYKFCPNEEPEHSFEESPDGWWVHRDEVSAHISALAERVERAEALLKEAKRYAKMFRMRCSVENCAACADALDLESRISSFLHNGTKGEGKHS